MQVETIINGGVSIILIPENEMEINILKQLIKQTTEITEIRGQVTVLNRIFNTGILIGKANTKTNTAITKEKDEETKKV